MTLFRMKISDNQKNDTQQNGNQKYHKKQNDTQQNDNQKQNDSSE